MGVWASQPAGVLHAAIDRDDLDGLVTLINAGASVNEPYNDQTPLQLAVQNSSVSITNRLLLQGAKLTTPYGNPDLGLMEQASKQKSQGLCDILARHGAPCSDKALNALVSMDCVDTVEHLLQTGTSPNARSRDKEIPALHLAVTNQNEAMTEILCQHGADVDQQDWKGCSAVHLATSCGNLPLVTLLVDFHASVNICDSDNITALHIACRKGYLDIARFLIFQGANVNVQRKGWGVDGFTPLHEAAKENHKDVVDLLCHSGADLGAEDFYMKTPLITACEAQSEACVDSLTKYGCYVGHKDISQNTPLLIAAKQRSANIIKSLLEVNCATNDRDMSQRTALHYAAERGCSSSLDMLLKKGAIFGIPDKYGRTALHNAIQSEDLSSVFCLLRHGHPFPAQKCKALNFIQMLSTGFSNVSHAVQIIVYLGWRPNVAGYRSLCSFLRENMPFCSLIGWLTEEYSKPQRLVQMARIHVRKQMILNTGNTSICTNIFKLNVPTELQDYMYLMDIEEKFL
jgi:ankyrin